MYKIISPRSHYPKASEASLGVTERSVVGTCLWTQRWLGLSGSKLGGMIEGMCENVLAKKFFGSVHQGQVGGPHVPLLGHGGVIETQNWACRYYWT